MEKKLATDNQARASVVCADIFGAARQFEYIMKGRIR
jgi:hypothetical protein